MVQQQIRNSALLVPKLLLAASRRGGLWCSPHRNDWLGFAGVGWLYRWSLLQEKHKGAGIQLCCLLANGALVDTFGEVGRFPL